jgi:hypothetical protein
MIEDVSQRASPTSAKIDVYVEVSWAMSRRIRCCKSGCAPQTARARAMQPQPATLEAILIGTHQRIQ